MDLCLCLQSDVRLSAIVITSLRRAYAELRPTSKENCSSLAYKCDCSTGARLNTHEQTTSGAQRQHGHVVVSCAPAPNANSHAVGLDDDHALVYVHRVRVMCQSPGKDTLGQKTVYIFLILLPLFLFVQELYLGSSRANLAVCYVFELGREDCHVTPGTICT